MFNVKFEVKTFTVIVTGPAGNQVPIKVDNDVFTREQKLLIQELRPGERVIIDQIRALGPDGITRDLSPLLINII